jgi:hypothetical protein
VGFLQDEEDRQPQLVGNLLLEDVFGDEAVVLLR